MLTNTIMVRYHASTDQESRDCDSTKINGNPLSLSTFVLNKANSATASRSVMILELRPSNNESHLTKGVVVVSF